MFADIGELEVQPDTPARVIIDERTGTIVIGARVRVSTVAVTHGNLTVRVSETPEVSQPNPNRPISSPRNAFWKDSLNVRPIAIVSPTLFICVDSVESASGNFSNAKRGILVTT